MRGIALSLAGFAMVAVPVEPARAVQLLGAAQALREAIGMAAPPSDRADHDRILISVRAELGEAAFTSAWERGRQMTPQQAIDYALARTET